MQVNRNMTWGVQHGADMQRQWLIAIGGGLVSAILLVSSITGAAGLLLAQFAALPVFMVGFMNGARMVVMSSSVAAAVMGFLGGPSAAILYLATTAVPAWIIVYHALSQRFVANGATDWFATGEIASRLAALVATVVAIAALAFNAQGGIESSVTNFVENAIILPVAKVMALDLDAQTFDQIVDRAVVLFPAICTLAWLFMTMVNAAIAQALLVKAGKALRPSPRYSATAAPDWAYWAFVAVAAVKLIGSGDLEYVAQNLVVILAAPFFLVGLAVAHSLVHRLKMPGLGLGLLYSSFLILTWAPVAVAIVGFAEHWVRLRDRYGRPQAA